MKYIFLISLLLVTIGLNAQKRFSLGAYGGLGTSFNTSYDDNSYPPKSLLDYNYGLSLCLRIKDSARIRLEGSVYRTGLKIDFPSQSSGTYLSKTKKNIYFWDITLRYDYKLVTYKKLDLYLSPGAKGLFLISSSDKTENSVGVTRSTSYINSEFSDKLFAPSLEVLFRYKLNNHWGITLAPEYSYFFKKFYDTSDGYESKGSMSQFDVKLGMEVNF